LILPKHFTSLNFKPLIPANRVNDDFYDLKELERHTIVKALQKVKFNKAEAARLLNIEWNALYRRIQKYDIDFPEDKL